MGIKLPTPLLQQAATTIHQKPLLVEPKPFSRIVTKQASMLPGLKSQMQQKSKFKFGTDVQEFLQSVLETLGNDVNILSIHTEHTRDKTRFRGSPRFLGKPWRDWAMINWGENIQLPGQIHCFVDLRDIPQGLFYDPGIYAVIESADKNEDPEEIARGDLFVPYIKETDGTDNDGNVKRKFYLIDCDCFASTACLIPDLGNDDSCAFLRLLPRSEWTKQFIAWLRTPHSRNFTE